MTLLNLSTILIRETYNKINPKLYPPVEYYSGRPLNPPGEEDEGDMGGSSDGHRIVFVNEIFEDSDHMQFRVIDVLGNGTFSYVFKCQIVNQDSNFVALKIIKNLPQYHATGVSEIFMHQLMAKAPDHVGKTKVIMPISTFEIDGHICMVLPLLSRSLFEGICQTQAVSKLLDNVRSIMRQLLQALAFIHTNNVIHCDVKPDNILYAGDNTDDIVLIDFGSATTAMSGKGQYIQSRFYRSFEVILGMQFNSQIDIWSAGCVAAELFLDFAIFACDCESDAVHSMVALLGPVPEHLFQLSNNWWKYYDMTPQGFKLKHDPNEILLTKHLYHSIYEQTGTVPLEELILQHCQLETKQELEEVQSFSHFVHGLLKFDPAERYNADQALTHPFITGESFSPTWKPNAKAATKVEEPKPQVIAKKPSQEISPDDFLSMM